MSGSGFCQIFRSRTTVANQNARRGCPCPESRRMPPSAARMPKRRRHRASEGREARGSVQSRGAFGPSLRGPATRLVPPPRRRSPQIGSVRVSHQAGTSAIIAQPPTIGWTAAPQPIASQADAGRPRTNSPSPPNRQAHANTFDSQPPITHSPAIVVHRNATANRAAAASLPSGVVTSGPTACRNPTASASQPAIRPTQAA